MRSSEIENLLSSKSESDREMCIPLLQEHLAAYPGDVRSWYDLACCFDFLGREEEAEPSYKKVFELGSEKLPANDQPGFYVGYGSTLRNNGKFDESKSILLQGTSKFPDNNALSVFLGLTLYSSGEHKEANVVLLKMAGRLPSNVLDGYDRAIKWYSENLR